MANIKVQHSLLLIFLLISFHSAQQVKNLNQKHKPTQNKLQTPEKKFQNQDIHMNCIDSSFKLIKINPSNAQEHNRILQTSTPHPFVIHGQFPLAAPAGITVNVAVLEKMFKISANYFKQVLKVTDLPAGSTTYPFSNNCFNSVVPNNLKTIGFDQTQMDLYVFIQIVNDTASSFVAQAGPCVILRWPTYGMTRYNANYVKTDLTKTGTFHNNVMTTLHEISHILGVSNSMFQLVYGSYTSTTQLTNSSIFGTSSNGKNMIILPNTKAYIQAYFGCTNTSVGAVIEDQGSSGSVGSHWERKVFYDDYMTASVWNSGAKLTQLSLAYFQDTGFYYSVDRTIAQPTYFGKNKGCDFAIGNDNTSTPQYCMTTNALDCGFSSQFGGPCNSNDQFDSGINLQRPSSNIICNMKQTIDGGSTTANQHYDWDGRCFMIQTFPRCLQAVCKASGIQINVFGAQTVVCGPTDTSVSSMYGAVPCPSNYDAFCGRRSCQNWCYTQGMCMKGSCILLPCSQAISSCLTCVTDKIHRCTSCTGGLYPSVDRLFCDSCGNIISGCLTCDVYLGNTVCTSCNNGNFPDLLRKTCVACGVASPNCLTCSIVNNFTTCSNCGNGYQANSLGACVTSTCSIANCNQCLSVGGVQNCFSCSTGFPTSNYLSCAACSNIIPNCQTCTFTTTTICQTCSPGYTVGNYGLSCEASSGTSCVIANCLSCVNNGTDNICNSCSSGFAISSNNLSCVNCNSSITRCLQCVNAGANINCTQCSLGYFISNDKLSCTICSNNITNCDRCLNNGGVVTCSLCSSNYLLTNSNLNCDTCGNIISQCSSCSLTGPTVCNACNNGYILSSDKLSCGDCSAQITNCQATSCNNNTGVYKCTSCTLSLYPSNDGLSCVTCSVKIAGCSTCVNNGNNNITCSACSANYLNSQKTSCTTCGNVISGCNVCSFNTTHTICNQCSLAANYPTPDQLSCSSCSNQITQCQTCSYSVPTLTCIQCINKKFPTLTNNACDLCQNIISNCLKCSYSTQTNCDQCLDGFLLVNGNCNPCNSNCTTCSGLSTTCTSCAQGYVVDQNNQCKQNTNVIPNFSGTCDVSGTQINCEYGCLYCQCSSSTTKTCLTPMEGFAVTGAGGVVQCGNGCKTCDPNNPTTTCYSCFFKYRLLGSGVCSQCNSSCSTCDPNNSNICLTCPQTFQLNSNNQCSKCSVNNCKICESVSTCSICKDGFYISSQGLCQQCVSDCGSCLQADIAACTDCRDMYYLQSSTGKCIQCPIGCLICDQSLACSSCIQGYQISLTDKKCNKICQFPCFTCSRTDFSDCTSCLGGYQLVNLQGKGVCNEVKTCTGTCSFCPLGSSISGSTCIDCVVNNCAKCDSNVNQCQSCKPGYYLDSSTSCLTCPVECKSCKSIDFCYTCTSGFTQIKQNSQKIDKLMKGKCVACQSPCKTCQKATNRCLSCISGYKLQKYICKLQKSVSYSLQINISYDNFMSKKMFKALKKLITQLFSFGDSNFMFHSIRNGSTIVQGQVGNPISSSGIQLCSQSQQMQNSLAQGSSFEGFNIISSSMQSSDGLNSCSTSGSDNTLYIIIGVGAGVPLLIIIIILIAVCIKRNENKGKLIHQKTKVSQNDTKNEIQINDLE